MARRLRALVRRVTDVKGDRADGAIAVRERLPRSTALQHSAAFFDHELVT